MKKITDIQYLPISLDNEDPFRTEVNDLIQNGWQPINQPFLRETSGTFVNYRQYYQTWVQYAS